jgi:hypothetical protein
MSNHRPRIVVGLGVALVVGFAGIVVLVKRQTRADRPPTILEPSRVEVPSSSSAPSNSTHISRTHALYGETDLTFPPTERSPARSPH